MEKINVFLFRVLCIYLYFAEIFLLFGDPLGYFLRSYDIEYLIIIAGVLVPFIYSFKKGKIKSKMVIPYEIAFCILFFAFKELMFEEYQYFLIKSMLLGASYSLIIWFLLSYYEFDKKE